MRYFDPTKHPSSLAELYDEALDAVQDSIMCDGISIFELSKDGLFLEFAATRTFVRDLLQGLKLPVGTGIAGQAAAKGEGLISNRAKADPDFFALPDQALRFQTRTVLCCPMRRGEQVVAVVELINKVDREPFTEDERATVQTLADSAAPNWTNAVFLGLRESFYDLTRMLRRAVNVEAVSLFTLDPERQELHLLYSDTTRKIDFADARLTTDQGVAGVVASSGRPILVPDVDDEPRFFKGVDEASLFKTYSLAAAPMVERRRLLGVLEVVNARGSESFTDDDVAVLARIAGELAPRMGLWV